MPRARCARHRLGGCKTGWSPCGARQRAQRDTAKTRNSPEGFALKMFWARLFPPGGPKPFLVGADRQKSSGQASGLARNSGFVSSRSGKKRFLASAGRLCLNSPPRGNCGLPDACPVSSGFLHVARVPAQSVGSWCVLPVGFAAWARHRTPWRLRSRLHVEQVRSLGLWLTRALARAVERPIGHGTTGLCSSKSHDPSAGARARTTRWPAVFVSVNLHEDKISLFRPIRQFCGVLSRIGWPGF